jgi:nucleoside-diphosphate-sugar epimerase
MIVFITGATGYIGGAIAARLVDAGHHVLGLTRSPERAEALRVRGIEPVIGDLDEADVLAEAARRADAVVNAASSDHRPAVDALLGALAGTGKPFLHTSGTSVLADDARGEPGEAVYDETTGFTPLPERAARAALDAAVLAAAERGVRSIVLCNSLIYGHGPGLHAESVQIPTLVRIARETGAPRHVGRGLNIWSTVHIEDVADLYLLALERAEPGSVLFVENGESSFKELAEAIGRALQLSQPAESWPFEEAAAVLGEARARTTFGSNSRVRARRARESLGWQPCHASAVAWIEQKIAYSA